MHEKCISIHFNTYKLPTPQCWPRATATLSYNDRASRPTRETTVRGPIRRINNPARPVRPRLNCTRAAVIKAPLIYKQTQVFIL